MAPRTITNKTWNWKISCLNFTNSASNQNAISLQALKGGLQLPADDWSMKKGGKKSMYNRVYDRQLYCGCFDFCQRKNSTSKNERWEEISKLMMMVLTFICSSSFLKLIIQSQWYGVNTQQPAALRKWSYGFDGGSRKKCGCCWWSVGKGIEWELADWICKTAPLSSLDNSFPPCVRLADNLR